jgi:hypothetical protein
MFLPTNQLLLKPAGASSAKENKVGCPVNYSGTLLQESDNLSMILYYRVMHPAARNINLII